MDTRKIQIILVLILTSLLVGQVSAVRYSPDNRYQANFDEEKPFATFRESSTVTKLLHFQYFTIFEMNVVEGNYEFSNQSYQLADQTYDLNQVNETDYSVLNYTTNLPNGANLSIAYFLYSSQTTVTLGNQSYDVDQNIIRASYSVTNWTFSNNDSYLSIHTHAYRERDQSGGGGGGNRTGWYMNMDSMYFSAKIMNQFSDNTSLYLDGQNNDRDVTRGTADPSIGTGGGSNETHEFQNNGIGIPHFDHHGLTDVFYTIKVFYDPSSGFLPISLYPLVILPILALVVRYRK